MSRDDVFTYIKTHPDIEQNARNGKMFGVLVVKTADETLGYLAAFSGFLAGCYGNDFFVPPIVDIEDPEGYFKTHEKKITAINDTIKTIVNSEEYRLARNKCDDSRAECDAELSEWRRQMQEAKVRRDEKRKTSGVMSDEEARALIRESQFMKAELVRLKKRLALKMQEETSDFIRMEEKISLLKSQRHTMSDELQAWLFDQYDMLDANGVKKNIREIFSETPSGTPPSGAGDCCAPKLLQYAYRHGMKPICMAEFWYGDSPRNEVRHHGHYYPACRGKCLPILGHMLQGLDVERPMINSVVTQPLEVIYEDRWLCVVNKPSGMMSVQGKESGDNVCSLMTERHKGNVFMPHRLDMDTSGILVLAYDRDTYVDLQRQFACHGIKKRYVALLDGNRRIAGSGRISLPLYADPLDRPYQKVDSVRGKKAETEYSVVGMSAGMTRVELFPLTGRTHQLRVHCAHPSGLGMPIHGDRLYGYGADRLYLHAESITFRHPATGKTMTFHAKVTF
ncbi:MAG: pseudouridine synthase [Prevotella sp.]